jgi:hypothetical protein
MLMLLVQAHVWWAAAATALESGPAVAVAITSSWRRHGSIFSTIPAAKPAPAAAVVVVLLLVRLHAAMPVASYICQQQVNEKSSKISVESSNVS